MDQSVIRNADGLAECDYCRVCMDCYYDPECENCKAGITEPPFYSRYERITGIQGLKADLLQCLDIMKSAARRFFITIAKGCCPRLEFEPEITCTYQQVMDTDRRMALLCARHQLECEKNSNHHPVRLDQLEYGSDCSGGYGFDDGSRADPAATLAQRFAGYAHFTALSELSDKEQEKVRKRLQIAKYGYLKSPLNLGPIRCKEGSARYEDSYEDCKNRKPVMNCTGVQTTPVKIKVSEETPVQQRSRKTSPRDSNELDSPPERRRDSHKNSPPERWKESPPGRHRESPPGRHRDSAAERHRDSAAERHRDSAAERHRDERQRNSPPKRSKESPRERDRGSPRERDRGSPPIRRGGSSPEPPPIRRKSSNEPGPSTKVESRRVSRNM